MSLLKIEWGNSILSLPKEGLLKFLNDAGGFELKVLILAAADDSIRNDFSQNRVELCKKLDCTDSALEKALNFWKTAGIITISDEAPQKAPEPLPEPDKPAKKTLQASSLPHYSESECADIISASKDLPDIIDMCQQLLGKIFTSADVEVLVALCDHLNLSPDYICCLVKYCADNGKKSLRYIERTALSLFDEGICTGDALNDYLRRKEKLNDSLTQIRKMTNSAGRELTTKEKKLFTCWLEEWKFDIEVITKAWEVTVDKINEPNVSYMNKVLENWHNSGLLTAADVDASLEAYKKKKEASQPQGQSSGFQTDEIMEAILKRSYPTT